MLSFGSRSLTRDHKFEVEKEQALRLIRLILSLPAPSPLVTVPIVRAIVALAESPEEKLRLASLQILGELGETFCSDSRDRDPDHSGILSFT